MAKIGASGRYKFVVRSLINSEGNSVRFATRYPPDCEECDAADEEFGPFFECLACGRGPENGGQVFSGDGDGIYPVLEVIDTDSDISKPIVVCVVFDSNYELANRIRTEAESSQKPSFSVADINNYTNLPAVNITSMKPSSLIILGSGFLNQAAIDCKINSEFPLIARQFVEEAGKYSGNFRTMNENSGTKVHVPRLLAIGSEKALEDVFGSPYKILDIDWADENLQAQFSVITSHTVSVAGSVYASNATIADSYLRNITQSENQIRNWDDDFFSWILLGDQINDEWCTKMLSETFGVPEKNKQQDLLARRVFELAAKTNSEPNNPHRYCSNCGVSINSGIEKFCSNCGEKIN